jgi:WD40 repeat protein
MKQSNFINLYTIGASLLLLLGLILSLLRGMSGKRKLFIFASTTGSCLLLVGGWTLTTLLMTDSFGHRAEVNALAFSPDSLSLASGSADGTVKLWDLETKKERLILCGQRVGRVRENAGTATGLPVRVTAVAFAPNGKTLAAGTSDETIKLWTLPTGEELAEFKVTPAITYGTAQIKSLAFSPDGTTLAAGVSNNSGEGSPLRCSVVFWQLDTGKEVQTYTGSFTPYPRVAFMDDGTLIAWVNADQVTLRHVSSGLEKYSVKKPDRGNVISLAISTDGNLLAVGEARHDSRGKPLDCDVVIWDLANRNEIVAMKGHTQMVSSVSFAPDGKLLASASWDGTVRLWDVASHKELMVLVEESGRMNAVAISPDGRTVASGGLSGKIRLTNLGKLLN